MATHRLIVFTEPKPGREAEYNQWYDQVHLKDVLEAEGFVAAQRFELSDAQIAGMGEGAPRRFLAIYEIETDDLQGALDRLNDSADRMHMTDALDTEGSLAFAYSAIGDRVSNA